MNFKLVIVALLMEAGGCVDDVKDIALDISHTFHCTADFVCELGLPELAVDNDVCAVSRAEAERDVDVACDAVGLKLCRYWRCDTRCTRTRDPEPCEGPL